MRKSIKSVALLSILGLTAVSCQKENEIYPMVGSEPFVGPKC